MSSFEVNGDGRWAGKPVAHRISHACPRQRIAVTGTVIHTALVRNTKGLAFHCILDDGTGQLALMFLGRRSVAGVEPGVRCQVEGTVQSDGDLLVVWNPVYVLQ
ncbi:MAG: OB-fold nucleic acid binding domain-containing protein [Acidimicrobiaceae bacterium]|nr:OB-fold nucleic acid binding domain-containing protein [Acidimicrobiaceae bacterium]